MNDSLPTSLLKKINHLKYNELHALQHYVGDRLASLREAKDFVTLKQFSLLDYVFFDYQGERKKGTIIKLNKRSATVLLDHDEGRWNVSPHFLSKIKGELSSIKKLSEVAG